MIADVVVSRIESAFPTVEGNGCPGLLARYPVVEPLVDEILQAVQAVGMRRQPLDEKLAVEAVEAFEPGFDVNGVVAIALARNENVAEHPHHPVLGRGGLVEMKMKRSGRMPVERQPC